MEKGEVVYSLAIGRVGEVMKVHHDGVTICPQSYSNRDGRHRHIHGFTTFESGDKVRMKYDSVKNRWLIVNKYWGRRWYEKAWDAVKDWWDTEISRLKIRG